MTNKKIYLVVGFLLFIFLIAPLPTLAITTIGPNIDTDGALTVDGALKFTSGATANYILQTDVSGNATWTSVSSALSSGGLTADDIPEGLTNLYYTDARADARISAAAGTSIASLVAGKVPSSQLPSLVITDVYAVADIAARDALSVQQGDVAVVADAGSGESRSYIYDGTGWLEIKSPIALSLLSANNLSDLANPATARTNLGLAIGTDVQAWSANLDSWSGLTAGSKANSGANSDITSLSGLTTALSIAQGGTGATTAIGALNALLPSQGGNVGKFLQTDGTNASWITGGSGTVTSVDASGGTTGLTFSGGPVTTSGTLTLGGTLAVANGGTGSATGAPGAFLGRQTLTSGTTYTPTSGTTAIVAELVGGGGGGGGATGTALLCRAGSGGGSGSYARKYFSGISSSTTYTIAIGSGGAGGSSTSDGSSGGNTTFACDGSCTGGAVTVTAFGGGGGPRTTQTVLGAALGGDGALVSTNGDLNTTGQPGGAGLCLSAVVGSSGTGGSSHLGGGGASVNSNIAGATAGNAAGNYGSGGGGAISTDTTGVSGGSGSTGVMHIWEFR